MLWAGGMRVKRAARSAGSVSCWSITSGRRRLAPYMGNTVAGPPGEATWLRIVARVKDVADESYTAYTSLDGYELQE